MSEKLVLTGDLAKGFTGLVGHFKKTAAFHKAAADHHEKLSKAHAEHNAFHKGKAEAMDDGDAMKSHVAKVAEHHATKAAHHAELHKLHKAQSDHCQEMADAYDVSDKAAGGEAIKGEKTGITLVPADISKSTNDLIAAAIQDVQKEETFKKLVMEIVAARLKEELKKTLEPTAASAIAAKTPPEAANRVIVRDGEDSELAKLLKENSRTGENGVGDLDADLAKLIQ